MSTPTATPPSGSTGGGTPAVDQSAPGWTWMIIIAIFLTAMVISVKGCKSKGGSGTGQTNSPPPQATVTVPAEKPWTFRIIPISREGVALYLYPGFKTWPKGGNVIITDPNGKTTVDQPGIIKPIECPPGGGIFTFRADPEGSERQEEILNRW